MDEFEYNLLCNIITICQYVDWKKRHPNKQVENVEEMLI